MVVVEDGFKEPNSDQDWDIGIQEVICDTDQRAKNDPDRTNGSFCKNMIRITDYGSYFKN